MRIKHIRSMMCDEAWPDGKDKPLNALACAECESMCLGGVEMLKHINEEEFQVLLCGGDCDSCRQPCNLRRIALMRKIKPAAVVVKAKAKPKRRTWVEIAMRPYLERRAADGKQDKCD